MLENLLHVSACIGFPAVALMAERRFRPVRTVGSVLLCYAFGLSLAHLPHRTPGSDLSRTVATLAVALAIPLLLFGLDTGRWVRMAGRTALSFGLCVVSVLTMGLLVGLGFCERVTRCSDAVGMLMGVYTGGTPNLAAIGMALRVPPETFLALNAADIVVSMLYLPFLLSLAPRWYGKILPPFPGSKTAITPEEKGEVDVTWCHRVIALAFSGLVVGAGVVSTALLPLGDFREAGAILAITTLAVWCSRVPRIRTWPGTHSTGHYLLLVFCVAIGSASDFGALWSGGVEWLVMTALVLFGASALHLGLAVLFRVDRDTLIITNTASIFGPAFVAPVAAALGNREVVLSGVASGLVGYAIGNYLGLGMAWALRGG